MNTIILLIIGVVLIVLNIRAIGNEKTSFNGVLEDKQENVKDYQIEITRLREEFSNTILELQQEIEELKDRLEDKNKGNSSNSEIELERKNHSANFNGIDKADTDDQSMQKQLSKLYEDSHSETVNQPDDNKDLHNEVVESSDDKNLCNEDIVHLDDSENTVKGSDGIRVNEIKKLLDEGMSVEDISQKLDLGKGEVLLIKELYIK